MAAYESIIQDVRDWVAATLDLSDPNNEVIPAAEGTDQGPRPAPRPYYVVSLLTPGVPLSEREQTYDAGLTVISRMPFRGSVRVEGFGEGCYDGLSALLVNHADLFDPISLAPNGGLVRTADLFSKESRIEPRGYVDFDVYYNLVTVPGTGASFVEGANVDFDFESFPDEAEVPTSYLDETVDVNLGFFEASEPVSLSFDPTVYGTVISYHTARGQEFSDGSSVPSITGDGPSAYVITAPAGSNEAIYNAAEPRYDFDGNDYYRAASKTPWDTLHQTPRGTLVVRVIPTSATGGALQTYFATSSFGTSEVGVNVCLDDRASAPGNNRLRLFVSRGVSGSSLYDTLNAGIEATLSVGTPTVFVFAWDGTDVRIYQDGVLLGTDVPAAVTPSASTSTALPAVGSSNGFFHLEDGLADLIVYSDKLAAAEVGALVTALEAEYG